MTATVLPLFDRVLDAGARQLAAWTGYRGWSAEQRATYAELMNLSDRQLEDIGLTRGLIEAVVDRGPAAVQPLQPEGAIQRNWRLNTL